ncbi:MAG: hypothetical protein V3U71_00170 [Cocleimonas sp.]
MVWNSKTLTSLVEKNFTNEEDLEEFKQQLQSIHRKIEIGRYHASNSLNAFKDFVDEDAETPNLSKAVKLLFGSTGEKRQNFLNARLVAEANTIALAHTLHSMSGIIANVLYSALCLPNSTDKKLIGISKYITDSDLKKSIVELAGSQQFTYLNAFVNNSKHMNLASSSYSVSFENDTFGMKFVSFKYKNRIYKEKWYKDFCTDVNFIYDKNISILCLLNEYLKENE